MSTDIPLYAKLVPADSTTPVADDTSIANTGAPNIGTTQADVNAAVATGLVTAVQTPNQVTVTFPGDGTVVFGTPQDIGTGSDPTFRDLTVRHLQGSGAAPTVSLQSGAGTGATSTVTGNDLNFNISITAGSAPAGSSANICNVFFAANYTSAPQVTVTPANRLTAALMSAVTTGWTWGAISTNGFALATGTAVTAALTQGSAYSWNVTVRGK